MTTETQVVAVTDALLAVADAIPDVTALDGDTNTDPLADVIAIGYSDEAAIVADRATGWGYAYVETINIVCSMWSGSGSVGYDDRRARCRDMIAAFRAGIAADSTLGGACDEARLGSLFAWRQALADDASGAYVSVRFTVEARTNI